MSGTRVAVVLVLLILVPPVALAQPADPNFPVTNGPVLALAQQEGTLYIGGNFSEISPATGAGVVFDPNTGAAVPGFPRVVGRVFAVVGDLAGGWYIGGLFTSVGGQPRANLARIAADLSVTPWNPGANEAVLALGVGFNGTVFVGGGFTTIGGQSRNRLAQVDSNGVATAWNPQPSSIVRALYVTGGSVYAGGDFTSVGGTSRNHFAQINSTTGALGTLNPNVNGTVNAIEIAARPGPTVSFLIGGTFTTVGGLPRTNLAEVTPTGTITSWAPNPNGTVYDIQDHNGVYVGGAFTFIGGFPRNRIAVLDPVSGIPNSWDPNVDDTVDALAWSLSHVVIGGKFKHVGGQPRARLARIHESTGLPSAFDPGPNEEVKAIAIGNGGVSASIYAGGEFTGLAGVPRNNLAAIDVASGAILPWAPDPDGVVRALQVKSLYFEHYKVWAGGDFTSVGGQPRARLAEIDPVTALPTSFSAGIFDGSVWTLAIRDTVVYVGGTFSQFTVTTNPYAVAYDTRTGIRRSWIPNPNGAVYSIVVGSSQVYLGGAFTQLGGAARNYIAGVDPTTGIVTYFPNANAPVRALLLFGSTLYAGGDFTTMGGLPRSRIAAFNTYSATPTAFDPGANGIVRCLARNGNEILVGGDFTTFGGQPRPRVASFDIATGALSPASTPIADYEIFAAVGVPPVAYLGGTFRGTVDLPQALLAKIGSFPPVSCPFTAWTTPAGQSPRALGTGDYDNDGIRDLAVCAANEVRVLHGSVSGGLGDGTFTLHQSLPTPERPMDAVFSDFDADGFEDLVVSQNVGGSGVLWLYRSSGGTFGSPIEFPLLGSVDGLAVADMDQDGILDVAACLTDSAGDLTKGGVELLRGTGAVGVWDGGFAPAPGRDSFLGTSDSWARRVILQDFNLDGTLDAARGPGTPLMVWLGPYGTQLCRHIGRFADLSSGYGMAAGDFNEDGLPDIATASGRRVVIRIKNSSLDPNCSGAQWFYTGVSYATPSTPRDHVVLDFDQDGHLDIVYTLDSLQTVGMLPGLGDGTFGAPQEIAQMNAWDIAAGDFVGDGRPDVVITQKDCGTVTVLTYPNAPLLGGDLSIVTPNGGEVWQAMFPSLPQNDSSVPMIPAEDGSSPIVAQETPAPTIENAHQVTWTKGPGVQGVDVAVSRNGGTTWQPIATNVPGTSMTWIATPPASSNARIRVTDSAVGSRADASDAPFQVTAGTVGVDSDLPLRVAFGISGGNPAAGRMRFRLELPSASDVDVQALDVRGRVVRNVARARYPAGRYELVWNAQDDRGVAARSGVYFVRARVGDFTEVRKVVLVH